MSTDSSTDRRTETVDGIKLTYPRSDWLGFLQEHFGPAILWAVVGIGANTVILAPTIGAQYGLFGLWIVALVFLVKWGGWELGIRYSYVTGRNPVEGYRSLPGPDNWGLWFTFIIYLIFWTVITGSVAGGAASFLTAAAPDVIDIELTFIQWYLALIAVIGTFVFFSSYIWLERLLKFAVAILALLIILGVLISPPTSSATASTLVTAPDFTDPQFIALFVGMAAYAPIGLSSTVVIGSWTMAKEQGAIQLREEDRDPKAPQYREYVTAWLRTGMRDYNLAFAFSFLLIASAILLATSTLWTAGMVPQDEEVPLVIGSLLESAYGQWAFYVMIAGAIAALTSTVLGNIDAISRVCSDILVSASDTAKNKKRWRRSLVVFVSVASIAPVLLIGNLPVVLITFSAALIAVFQVFFYVANYYIVNKHLPEALQPSRRRTMYYAVSMVVVFLFGVLGAINEFGIVGA